MSFRSNHRRSTARERGTFLVLVVAILAFLSLLTIAYVTIGRSDERTSIVLRDREQIDAIEDQVADYIAQIIADDATAPYHAGFALGVQDDDPRRINPVVPMLEAWDYPSTSTRYVSTARGPADDNGDPVTQTDTGFWGFEPTGVFGDDPWLADAEPTFRWVNEDYNLPFYPDNERTPTNRRRPDLDGIGSEGVGLLPPFNTGRDDGLAALRVDWGQISNVAPDGRFVNLFFLRNNFEARHGFDFAEGQLSAALTHPGDLDTLVRDNDDFNDDNVPDLLQPHIWTTNQFNAARPLELDDSARISDAELLNSPKFLGYQWADADGDGFLDSRWFELVDNRRDDPGGGDAFGRGGVSNGSDVRWFAAARIVDLSAMVNLQTATSFRADPREISENPLIGSGAPTGDFPAGLTPADIDLRRLLTLQDQIGQTYDQSNVTDNVLPYNMEQPNSTTSSENYRGFNPDLVFQAGDRAYEQLRLELLTQSTEGVLGGGRPDNPVDFENDPDYRLPEGFPGADEEQRYDYAAIDRAYAFTLAQRALLGETLAELPLSANDALELKAFGNANDSSVYSGLESILSVERQRNGRAFSGGGGGAQSPPRQPFLHVLRSGRGDATERLGRNNSTSGSNDERWTDNDAVAHLFSDVRQRLTTISGARPLRARVGFDGALTAEDLRFDAASLLGSGGPAVTTRLFDVYADALLPFSNRTIGETETIGGEEINFAQVWNYDNGSNPEHNELRTLFYGHRGPEFALLSAAHAAVNMADLIDDEAGDTTRDPITSRTVLVDGNAEPGSLKEQLFLDSARRFENRNHAWAYPAGGEPVFATGDAAVQAELNYAVLDADGFTNLGVSPTGRALADAGEIGADEIARRLADTADGDTLQGARAYNVYGIEPTPILTEIAAYHIYTDAPEGVGGDGEGDEWRIVVQAAEDPFLPAEELQEWIGDGPTIDPDVTAANPDFVAQVVAIQVHNPFDTPIPLVTRDNAGQGATLLPRFYFQFGERTNPDTGDIEPRFWPMAPLNVDDVRLPGDFQSAAPTLAAGDELRPGETRVIVLLTRELDGPDSYEERMARIIEAYDVGAGTDVRNEDAFLAWLDRQLTVQQFFDGNPEDVEPWLIAEFNPEDPTGDPSTLRPTTGAPIVDLLDATDDPNRIAQVLLWRAVYVGGELAGTASLDNDQLVDRLRDPNLIYGPGGSPFPTLREVRLPTTGTPPQFEIESANPSPGDSGPFNPGADPTESVGEPGLDNTGFSFTTYAAFRRPTNVPLNNARAFPAWVYERKFVGILPTGNLLNADDELSANIDDADLYTTAADGVGAGPLYERFQDLLREQTGISPSGSPAFDPVPFTVLRSMTGEVEDKAASATLANALEGSDHVSATLRFENVLTELPITERETTVPTDPAAPLFTVSTGSPTNGRTFSALRAGDFLRPLAIGPRFDPGNGTIPTPGQFSPRTADLETLEEAWLTLPEALALAAGYYDTASSRGTNGDRDVSLGVGGSDLARTAGAPAEPLLDRGVLRADTFVPFVDADTDGVFDPTTDDQIVGAGAPLAAGVVDQLNAVAVGTADGPRTVGGLDRAIPGLVNVNTASIEVLRTLPLLSPAPHEIDMNALESSGNSLYNFEAFWWGQEDPTGGSLPGAVAEHDARSDIAAALVGYRDLIAVNTRPVALSDFEIIDGLATAGVDPDVLDYSINPELPATTGRRNDPVGLGPIVGNDQVRNEPGLLSQGELLAVRATAVGGTTDYREPHSIDRLGISQFIDGLDSLNIDEPGIDPLRLVDDPSADPLGESDNISDEPDQRLAIANALFNTTSVRSDYYVVWFVLHGYRAEDAEGLAPNDRLAPSVRRRFVMLVDRSNVTRPGQPPRIIGFRQVAE